MPLPVYSQGLDEGRDGEHDFVVTVLAANRTFYGRGANTALARRAAAAAAYAALFGE